ncbi:hypothetical protein NZK35_01825 [Stieleria sp. ICT_E10.1]|uniref:hypothetical protein n=1 Tax=Stieleria sedimenti TaxID=2976331 RepID=UPI00217F2C5D|nr:hypothetical protein [Stieleria sedimenti]MCS7465406.1 hypothetical protein [Stieleria sedimenti]
MRRFSLLLFSCLLIPLSGDASGATVTYTLTGSVTNITATDLAGNDDTASFLSILPYNVGAPVTATFSYDSNNQDDRDSRPQYGSYDGLTMSVSVGSTTFDSYGSLSLIDFGTRDEIRARGLQLYNAPGWSITGLGGGYSGLNTITLVNGNTSLWDGTLPPTDPFAASDFSTLNWQMQDTGFTGGNRVTTPLGSHTGMTRSIEAVFNTVTVTAIPEPSSSAFCALALGVCWIRRRRPRH